MTTAPAAAPTAAAVLRLVATLVALVLGEAILWRAGASLPALPLDGGGLRRTLDEADPLAVSAGLLRLAALAVGAGLVVTTGLGILSRACGAARLTGRLDRWTPPTLRRLLDGAVGAGLAASIGIGVLPAAGDPGGSPAPTAATLRRLPDAAPAVLRRLPDASPDHSRPVVRPGGPSTTLRRLPEPPPPEQDHTGLVAPAPLAAAPTPRLVEVVVQPGDSFWLIAQRHEAERLRRRPTVNEVGACWQALVAANRHRLAIPDDPDLIFPGQTFVVPCP